MGRKPLLTPEQAEEVRSLYHDRSAKWTVTTLAHCYDVQHYVIQAALNRRGAYGEKKMSKNQIAGDKCPLCAKRAILHTNARVRALGVRLRWDEAQKPLAVCVACYAALTAYGDIVFADAVAREQA